jgi:lambda repressor-like predicted transcriptional regulator
MKTYTQDDVLATIRTRTDASSIRSVAKELGLSAAYLSDVLLGNRQVSDKVAESFGFQREVVTEIRFRKAS